MQRTWRNPKEQNPTDIPCQTLQPVSEGKRRPQIRIFDVLCRILLGRIVVKLFWHSVPWLMQDRSLFYQQSCLRNRMILFHGGCPMYDSVFSCQGKSAHN